eukprot:6183973-Pleurochrysis_carterae.AAC.5
MTLLCSADSEHKESVGLLVQQVGLQQADLLNEQANLLNEQATLESNQSFGQQHADSCCAARLESSVLRLTAHADLSAFARAPTVGWAAEFTSFEQAAATIALVEAMAGMMFLITPAMALTLNCSGLLSAPPKWKCRRKGRAKNPYES